MPNARLKSPRAVRIRIRLSLEIRGSRQSFRRAGIDLSVEGLCFRSPILPVHGERAGASLLFRNAAPIPLSLEVRWVRSDGPSHYRTGGEFVRSAESRKSFQNMLWQVESGTLQGVGNKEEA